MTAALTLICLYQAYWLIKTHRLASDLKDYLSLYHIAVNHQPDMISTVDRHIFPEPTK